jgi:hypothetical protein
MTPREFDGLPNNNPAITSFRKMIDTAIMAISRKKPLPKKMMVAAVENKLGVGTAGAPHKEDMMEVLNYFLQAADSGNVEGFWCNQAHPFC